MPQQPSQSLGSRIIFFFLPFTPWPAWHAHESYDIVKTRNNAVRLYQIYFVRFVLCGLQRCALWESFSALLLWPAKLHLKPHWFARLLLQTACGCVRFFFFFRYAAMGYRNRDRFCCYARRVLANGWLYTRPVTRGRHIQAVNCKPLQEEGCTPLDAGSASSTIVRFDPPGSAANPPFL